MQQSKWQFSGGKQHLQKEFKMKWKCELQLQVSSQPQILGLSFIVDLRLTQHCPQSIRVQGSKEAMGPKLHF